jgi:hypothetical protein
LRQRGHRNELGIVIDHLVIDLVRQQNEPVLAGKRCDLCKRVATVNGPTGVVRVDHDDRPSPRADQCLDLCRIRYEIILWRALVIARLTAIQRNSGGPQRIIRTGDEHLIPVIEERAQRQV